MPMSKEQVKPRFRNLGTRITSMDELDAMPLVLTPDEVSKITGHSAKFVRDKCRDGTIPAAHVGNTWRIPKSGVMKLLGIT